MNTYLGPAPIAQSHSQARIDRMMRMAYRVRFASGTLDLEMWLALAAAELVR